MKPIFNLIKGHLQSVEVYEELKGIDLLAVYDGPWECMEQLYILATPEIPTYPEVPESPK